jgi:hypothetical protein
MGTELGLDAFLQIDAGISANEKPGRPEIGAPWHSQWLMRRRRAG